MDDQGGPSRLHSKITHTPPHTLRENTRDEEHQIALKDRKRCASVLSLVELEHIKWASLYILQHKLAFLLPYPEWVDRTGFIPFCICVCVCVCVYWMEWVMINPSFWTHNWNNEWYTAVILSVEASHILSEWKPRVGHLCSYLLCSGVLVSYVLP